MTYAAQRQPHRLYGDLLAALPRLPLLSFPGLPRCQGDDDCCYHYDVRIHIDISWFERACRRQPDVTEYSTVNDSKNDPLTIFTLLCIFRQSANAENPVDRQFETLRLAAIDIRFKL